MKSSTSEVGLRWLNNSFHSGHLLSLVTSELQWLSDICLKRTHDQAAWIASPLGMIFQLVSNVNDINKLFNQPRNWLTHFESEITNFLVALQSEYFLKEGKESSGSLYLQCSDCGILNCYHSKMTPT